MQEELDRRAVARSLPLRFYRFGVVHDFLRSYTGMPVMQRLQKIGSASALKPGWVMEAEADGETFAVINVAGEIRVFEGSCPCTGGPLGHGAIRDGLLVCPWHGWRFDCESGVCYYNHEIRIRRIPVTVQNDDILIEIADVPKG